MSTVNCSALLNASAALADAADQRQQALVAAVIALSVALCIVTVTSILLCVQLHRFVPPRQREAASRALAQCLFPCQCDSDCCCSCGSDRQIGKDDGGSGLHLDAGLDAADGLWGRRRRGCLSRCCSCLCPDDPAAVASEAAAAAEWLELRARDPRRAPCDPAIKISIVVGDIEAGRHLQDLFAAAAELQKRRQKRQALAKAGTGGAPAEAAASPVGAAMTTSKNVADAVDEKKADEHKNEDDEEDGTPPVIEPGMEDALEQCLFSYAVMVRRVVLLFSAYEVRQCGDSFVIAVVNPVAAVKLALELLQRNDELAVSKAAAATMRNCYRAVAPASSAAVEEPLQRTRRPLPPRRGSRDADLGSGGGGGGVYSSSGTHAAAQNAVLLASSQRHDTAGGDSPGAASPAASPTSESTSRPRRNKKRPRETGNSANDKESRFAVVSESESGIRRHDFGGHQLSSHSPIVQKHMAKYGGGGAAANNNSAVGAESKYRGHSGDDDDGEDGAKHADGANANAHSSVHARMRDNFLHDFAQQQHMQHRGGGGGIAILAPYEHVSPLRIRIGIAYGHCNIVVHQQQRQQQQLQRSGATAKATAKAAPPPSSQMLQQQQLLQQQEFDYTGTTPEIAARLCVLAHGHQLLVSQEVVDAVRLMHGGAELLEKRVQFRYIDAVDAGGCTSGAEERYLHVYQADVLGGVDGDAEQRTMISFPPLRVARARESSTEELLFGQHAVMNMPLDGDAAAEKLRRISPDSGANDSSESVGKDISDPFAQMVGVDFSLARSGSRESGSSTPGESAVLLAEQQQQPQTNGNNTNNNAYNAGMLLPSQTMDWTGMQMANAATVNNFNSSISSVPARLNPSPVSAASISAVDFARFLYTALAAVPRDARNKTVIAFLLAWGIKMPAAIIDAGAGVASQQAMMSPQKKQQRLADETLRALLDLSAKVLRVMRGKNSNNNSGGAIPSANKNNTSGGASAAALARSETPPPPFPRAAIAAAAPSAQPMTTNDAGAVTVSDV